MGVENKMKQLIFIAYLLVWGFVGSGIVVAEEASAMSDDYRLATGDRLRVSVYGHDDLSGEFEVDGKGQLSLPLIQDIDAANKTLNELEADITDELQPDYLKNPRVSVEILSYRPFYIVGEVNDPGSYPFVSGMTVINGVALAGGFTYRAQKTRIKIIRDRTTSKEEIEASADTAVLPGDVIEIGERFF
jgi:protein involved in polysaccharide export with SLBB domain